MVTGQRILFLLIQVQEDLAILTQCGGDPKKIINKDPNQKR